MDPDELRYNILKQIAHGLRRHGWGIARSINDRCQTNLKAKKLYPILEAFSRQGLTEVVHTPECDAGSGKIEHFITDAGRTHLQQLEREMVRKAERIRRSLEFGPDGCQRRQSNDA